MERTLFKPNMHRLSGTAERSTTFLSVNPEENNPAKIPDYQQSLYCMVVAKQSSLSVVSVISTVRCFYV